MTKTLPAIPHPDSQPSLEEHIGLEGLVDLACRDGVDIRPTLLRVLTDLYVQKPLHTAAEERHYVELASHLIDTVDEATRRTVMDRLANYSAPPAALMRPRQPQPMPPAMETHSVLPPLVPASTAARDTAEALTDDLSALFFSASPAERRMILINLDAAAPPAEPKPIDMDRIRQLESAALAHDTAGFATGLTQALGLDRGQALSIATDISGEAIVVAARALAMPAAVMQRVLLFLNPAIGQSVQRVYDLAALYDEITPAAASWMVSIWRDNAKVTQRAPHQPVLAQDERTRPRREPTPGPYRAVERDIAASAPYRAGSTRRQRP